MGADGQSITVYVEQNGQSRGWWANIDKYIVSLLKAWYGDAATADNDFGFGWLPRISGDHSHFGYGLDMADATGTDRRPVRDGTEPRGRCARCVS